jgi:hypothetical protein
MSKGAWFGRVVNFQRRFTGFLPFLPQDTSVRWRAPCANLTAMTPDQFRISAEVDDLYKSGIPTMRNACDVVFCSVFRCRADQLTVFPCA